MPRPAPLPQPISRRTFLAVSSVGALTACGLPGITDVQAKGSPRLSARWGAPTSAGAKGLRALGLGDSVADGVVYVPPSYSPSVPAPLVLLLHPAGGSGSTFITRFTAEADATGQILVAPDSRKITWDGIGGSFGPDITFLTNALNDTFAKYNIDAKRVAVGGFSDGATMSLAVGLATGDFFSKVTAWSPGGFLSDVRNGKPPVFVSHGLQDTVLLIGATSRVIVADLRNAGYTVTYNEFVGMHDLPADQLHAAMVWMAT